MASLPDFWRTFLMNWCLFFAVFFALFLIPALILLGSMNLFRMFLRRVIRSNPANYRPIALASAVAKVFETWLDFHFNKHLESYNHLSDHQYGFLKARSTEDLLSYLTHAWSSSHRNFRKLSVVTLDISKAFDRVWHKALLAKIPACSFSPSVSKRISSFLSNRFVSVVVDGVTSASFWVSSGIPQGPVFYLLSL